MRRNPLHPMFYATYFPLIKRIARKYGYAVAVHGSLKRDMDLIAVPWVEKTKDPVKMLGEIKERIGFNVDGYKEVFYDKEKKPHGRIAYTIQTGMGGYLDISVMPVNKNY